MPAALRIAPAMRFSVSVVGSGMMGELYSLSSLASGAAAAAGSVRFNLGDALLLGDLNRMGLQARDGRNVHVLWATDMKECRSGVAMWPPVLPDAIGRLSSLPSQTPPTYLPVKPTNQLSVGPVRWCRSCRRRW